MTSPRAVQAAAWTKAFLRSHWPLLPVLALALWLRVRDLQPVFFYGDDAEYGIVASYLAGNPLDMTYPRIAGFWGGPFVSQPPLVLYLFAAAFAVLGIEDANAVYVSVLLGTATVGLVYALGVLMKDRATGFVAGAFLAVMPFHVALSRKALLEAGLAFFMALAAVLLLYYFRAPSARRATWVGVGIGLAALAKLPGFLIGIVLLLYAGVELAALVARKRRGEVAAKDALAAMPKHALRATLVAALFPLLWIALVLAKGGWEDFVDKLTSQAERVAGGANDASQSLTSQPWTWYLGDHDQGIPALISPTIYGLAFAGSIMLLAVFAFRPLRSRTNALPLLWLAVVFGFFAFADRKVWFYTLPLTPALALAAGYPISGAWRGIHRLMTRAASRSDGFARVLRRPVARGSVHVALAVALFLATAVPAWGVTEGSREKTTGPLVEHKFGVGVKEAALYVAEHDPQGGQVGTLLGRFTIHFYHPAPTYHYFVDNGYGQRSRWTVDAIERGEVRWVVVDNYLDNAEEQAWLMKLVNEHGGTLEKTWGSEWGSVRLYRLNA